MSRVGTLRVVCAAAALVTALTLLPAASAGPTSHDVATAPVLDGDFADPYVLPVRALDGSTTWFSFATNTFEHGNVPVAVSRDLRTWSRLRDALPVKPTWAIRGPAWAPAVLELGGRFHLFASARSASTGLFCVARAESLWPEGPYSDSSLSGLVCQDDRGGAIDPSPFVDADGTPWLLWKSEGRAGDPARLWSQRLSADGRSLVGPRRSILVADRAWEGGVVEAPSMVRAWGAYWLLYSGNRWDTDRYAVGYARCASPAGPCAKAAAPILAAGPGGPGPGSLEAFTLPDGTVGVAYHAWSGARVGYPDGVRSLRVGRLVPADGRLAVRAL